MDLSQAPEQLSAYGAIVWSWTLTFLPRLIAALAIIIVGYLVAGWLSVEEGSRTGEEGFRTAVAYVRQVWGDVVAGR